MKKQVGNKLRGSAGFTLVELVVVIAIIGILAGIGTVGYGGYVKKANEAADQQLLGEVNTAFAAACVENGTEGALFARQVRYSTARRLRNAWVSVRSSTYSSSSPHPMPRAMEVTFRAENSRKRFIR